MKVHQLARGFWEHEPSLTLGCKRLRPLAPKLSNTTDNDHTTPPSFAPLDLKSFIRPESGPRRPVSSSFDDNKKDDPASPQGQMQVETPPGGTRWNPTQEQIGILEMLYRGGMRTPHAQQIEQITAQLGKYGKIEGKNVFYWFQNHKARERQKQKRNTSTSTGIITGISNTSTSTSLALSPKSAIITLDSTRGEVAVAVAIERDDRVQEDISPYKKKCRRSWGSELEDRSWSSCNKEEHTTLELFPLHPESR